MKTTTTRRKYWTFQRIATTSFCFVFLFVFLERGLFMFYFVHRFHTLSTNVEKKKQIIIDMKNVKKTVIACSRIDLYRLNLTLLLNMMNYYIIFAIFQKNPQLFLHVLEHILIYKRNIQCAQSSQTNVKHFSFCINRKSVYVSFFFFFFISWQFSFVWFESVGTECEWNRSWFWVVIIATLNIININFDSRQIQKTCWEGKRGKKPSKHRERIVYTLMVRPVKTIANKQISMRPFCTDAFKWQTTNEQTNKTNRKCQFFSLFLSKQFLAN